MGIFDKLRRKRETPKWKIVTNPLTGESARVRVIDLRSEEEKEIERRAQFPLEGEYEPIAHRLYDLIEKQAEPLVERLYERLDKRLTVYKLTREEWADLSLEKLPKDKYGRYEADMKTYITLCREIRKIGEQLCDNGDDAKMRLVGYRFRALGGHPRVLESYWNGICGWMV